MFDIIAFDADDTLWHNETLYSVTQDRFTHLLARYHSPDWIEEKLYETEMRNLGYFGYGVKGFTLSMIETAIELTEGRIRGQEIQEIIDLAKTMLRANIQLLEHTRETISRLAALFDLMLITKGDLFDQETKIARSGLADYFKHVEIVSEKTEETYQDILAGHNISPGRFMMVGNSLKSDILPVLAGGGWAVYIPYELTWRHERVTHGDADQSRFFELEHIGLLPALLESLRSYFKSPAC